MENYFVLENPVPVGSTVPREFKVLPLGLVHSQKGNFLVDYESFESIRKNFQNRKLQIPVDYEHQTLKDVQAPAAGWIKDIVLKADGIYAVVDWTDRASEYLKNREYKYCSPVITASGSSRRATALHSVALTNTPAIDDMTPIVNKAGPTVQEEPNGPESGVIEAESGNEEPDVGVILERLTELLRLPDTASIQDIYEAVSQLMGDNMELKLNVDTLKFEAHRMKAENAVQLALKDGKVIPPQRDWAFQYALRDTDEFVTWLKSAPQIVPMGRISDDDEPPRRGSRSDELLGLTPDDIRKYRPYGENP